MTVSMRKRTGDSAKMSSSCLKNAGKRTKTMRELVPKIQMKVKRKLPGPHSHPKITNILNNEIYKLDSIWDFCLSDSSESLMTYLFRYLVDVIKIVKLGEVLCLFQFLSINK